MTRVKQYVATKVISALLTISTRTSKSFVLFILRILRKITPSQIIRDLLETVLGQIDTETPFSQFLVRFTTQVNPRCRERFIFNFVANFGWGNFKVKREAFKDVAGFYPPLAYLISPTMRCNLHCPDCYAGNYKVEEEMPLKLINRILFEGKENGCFFVTILGGEPFIRRDIWEIFQQHPDLIFQVFTNATLLKETDVEKLARLGNVIPVISLEGYKDETDSRRGEGTFEKIMQAMHFLSKAGVPFGFSCTITQKNINSITSDEFNRLLVDKGALYGWHFLYMPVGRNPDLNLMPTPEQRNWLRTNGARRIREKMPLLVFDFWNDAPYVGGCIAAGKSYFHINSNGDVEPCVFAHFAVDNIKNKNFRAVLTSEYFEAIRNHQPYSENLLLPCMLIDHPQIFREIFTKYKPYPTHPGAISLINDLEIGLDAYSNGVACVLEHPWMEEYVTCGFGSKYEYEDVPLSVLLKKKRDNPIRR